MDDYDPELALATIQTLESDVASDQAKLDSLEDFVEHLTAETQKIRAAIGLAKQPRATRVYRAVGIPAGCTYKGGVVPGSKVRILFTQLKYGEAKGAKRARLAFNLGHNAASDPVQSSSMDNLDAPWAQAGGFVPGSAFWRAHGLSRSWMSVHEGADACDSEYQATLHSWSKLAAACRDAGQGIPERPQPVDLPRVFLLNVSHSGTDPDDVPIDTLTARGAKAIVRVDPLLRGEQGDGDGLSPDAHRQLHRARRKLVQALREHAASMPVEDAAEQTLQQRRAAAEVRRRLVILETAIELVSGDAPTPPQDGMPPVLRPGRRSSSSQLLPGDAGQRLEGSAVLTR